MHGCWLPDGCWESRFLRFLGGPCILAWFPAGNKRFLVWMHFRWKRTFGGAISRIIWVILRRVKGSPRMSIRPPQKHYVLRGPEHAILVISYPDHTLSENAWIPQVSEAEFKDFWLKKYILQFLGGTWILVWFPAGNKWFLVGDDFHAKRVLDGVISRIFQLISDVSETFCRLPWRT